MFLLLNKIIMCLWYCNHVTYVTELSLINKKSPFLYTKYKIYKSIIFLGNTVTNTTNRYLQTILL